MHVYENVEINRKEGSDRRTTDEKKGTENINLNNNNFTMSSLLWYREEWMDNLLGYFVNGTQQFLMFIFGNFHKNK